jgi:hypothetical protein
MCDWTYEGKPIDFESCTSYFGFVYKITNKQTGKAYIGKKKLKFTRSKKVKDSKRRIRVTKESDWKDYYGSSEELAKDIHILGKEGFDREILRWCTSAGDCSYWELWHQMTNHVLLNPADWYNSYVGARIHRKHLMKKVKEKI